MLGVNGKEISTIIIADWFPIYDRHGIATEKKEYVASHGLDPITGQMIQVSCDHPSRLGAVVDELIGEWVIYK